MRHKIIPIAAIAVLMLSGCHSPREKEVEPETVIDLFEGPVPGAIAEAPLVEDDSQPWISSVPRPTLAYYRATGGTGAAVVICPGGAYGGLSYAHEGTTTARWLSSQGIQAFILKYRLPDDRYMADRKNAPLQDVQQAVRYVRAHAADFGVDPTKIGVMGFSAGGHLASLAATHYADSVYTSDYDVSARPDFSLLIYPVITMDTVYTHGDTRAALIGRDADRELTDRYSSEKQVTEATPPAFLVHALDDSLVPYWNSIMYADALRKKGVQCELHLYASGDHGLFIKDTGATYTFWHDACEKWLRMNGWMK